LKKKARREVLPTRRANYAHRRKRGVQHGNNNTLTALSVLFRTDKTVSVSYFACEQGEMEPETKFSGKAAVPEYGSIFIFWR